MNVKDIMQKDVEKAETTVTVSEAAVRMTEKDIGYLIVVKNSRLAGIITEDDIIKKVVGEGNLGAPPNPPLAGSKRATRLW